MEEKKIEELVDVTSPPKQPQAVKPDENCKEEDDDIEPAIAKKNPNTGKKRSRERAKKK